ncbi:hypothetical protein [Microbacterium marinilacus]|nr:hypothetical protein [Microbacterium marinilacus]MBY0688290.1 hypothetical protein [Microbacterium marinilacus]
MKKKTAAVCSALAAGALVLTAPLSASAAVTTSVSVDNSTKTWSVDPVIANLAGSTRIPVSGSGFNGFTLPYGNGVYVAFGGENFTSQDAGYYEDAVWASPTATSTTETRVLLSGGAFSNAYIDVVQAYDDIDCLVDENDTVGEQCYIYTFSGHGAFPDAAGDPNYSEVPVYFE